VVIFIIDIFGHKNTTSGLMASKLLLLRFSLVNSWEIGYLEFKLVVEWLEMEWSEGVLCSEVLIEWSSGWG
jgi:hypothetical protein